MKSLILILILGACSTRERVSVSGFELQEAAEKCWSFDELDSDNLGECMAQVIGGEI
jgi:hypothetical protein